MFLPVSRRSLVRTSASASALAIDHGAHCALCMMSSQQPQFCRVKSTIAEPIRRSQHGVRDSTDIPFHMMGSAVRSLPATNDAIRRKEIHPSHLHPDHVEVIDSTNKPAVITTMRHFVQQVPDTVRERKEKGIPPGSPNDPVIELFRQTQLAPNEWNSYAFWDPARPYTRNLIATDRDTFTLLLLCWNPLQESPIHDHPCDGCWLRVLQGHIQECRYNIVEKHNKYQDQQQQQQQQQQQHDHYLECIADHTFGTGQIAYITDNMGYHKIGNPTVNQPAVSLHLYAPPIQQCRTWKFDKDDADAADRLYCEHAVAAHYSEYGFRVPET